MANQEYIDKLILRAADPNITSERKRLILWKALREMGCDDTSVRWQLKMKFKMWVHEKLTGDKWCE